MKSATEHFQAIGDQLDSGDDAKAQAWLRGKAPTLDLVKLPGDASTRKYYRLVDGKKSNILMKMESFAEHGDKLPFLAVQRSLKGAGVDVPEILGYDAKRGLILLEDLGDVTLLKNLQSVTDTSVERRMYERVIDGLVRMQVGVTQDVVSEKLDAFSLRLLGSESHDRTFLSQTPFPDFYARA
jgi:aminoglycoside/choline kinase family phosphotransferase